MGSYKRGYKKAIVVTPIKEITTLHIATHEPPSREPSVFNDQKTQVGLWSASSLGRREPLALAASTTSKKPQQAVPAVFVVGLG